MPLSYVESYTVNPGGSIVHRETAVGTPTPAGVRATGSGLSFVEGQGGTGHITITFASFTMTVVDTGGVNGGQGSKLLYTFPKGVFQPLGANVDLTIAADSNMANNAAVVAALGTTAAATDNATLLTTEANLVASTTATLSSSAGAFSAFSGTTALGAIDGRTTAPGLYLNFAVPDAGITANSVLTINGTIKFSYLIT